MTETAQRYPARGATSQRVPTQTRSRSTSRGQVSAQQVASGQEPAESLDRFFPGFYEVLLPAATALVPEIIKMFQSREAESADRERAYDRDLSQLLAVLGPLLTQVVPVVIDEISNITQQRSRDGADPIPDDEALERFFPALLGALVPTLVSALPAAIQEISSLFGNGRDGQVPLPRVVDSEVTTRFLGPVFQLLAPTLAATLPQLFSIITGAAGRDIGMSWLDFTETNRLQDNDSIVLINNEPIDDSSMTEIVLELAPHKTWWKGIQIQDPGGAYVDEIGVQDDNKVASVRVPSQILVDPGGYLLFMKAKMFGVHTGMYRLNCGGLAEQLRGRRATFYWYAD
jgi:hypothetical protein